MLSDKSAAVRMEAAQSLTGGIGGRYFMASQLQMRQAALADYIRLQLASSGNRP
ncbi:MAG: hypothetical protein R3C26_10590 [Calditrichia bacterium]